MDHSTAPKLFYAILFIFLGLLCWLCWTFLSAIVLGLVITSAFHPLYSWYKGLFKGSEIFKAASMTIFIFLILTIPISGFVGSLYSEALGLYGRTRNSVSLQKIQEILKSDSIWVKRIKKISEVANIELDDQSIQKTIATKLKDFGLYLTTQLSSVVSNLMNFLLDFLLMILIIYYIFRDGPILNNYLLSLLPFPKAQQELILAKFHEMGRAIIFGNGLSGIIQGILGGFAFYFFGLGSPFLWGTVMGFLAFLPVIGASVVFIPATIILLLQNKIGASVAYFIYNATYSIIIEYFIKPKLIGKGMKMNTIFVFIGILGGLKLWGILGIIYGPFIVTIIFTLFEIYRLEYRPANIQAE
ncbi:MAG: AI-2E family transporter [Desulfobacteraceae bacterium]